MHARIVVVTIGVLLAASAAAPWNQSLATAECPHVNAGGNSNIASPAAACPTVSGGQSNVANADYAVVSAGWSNRASGNVATIGGGGANEADGYVATIAGGEKNVAKADHATIGGGWSNQ